MINWWLFALLCTIAAVFLGGLANPGTSMPYRDIMLVAILIIVLPLLALMWLFCFLISASHP